MIDLGLLPDGGLGWLDGSGAASHLVLSTRIRLARNLAEHRFSARASEAEREAILAAVAEAATDSVTLRRAVTIRLDNLPSLDRQLLHERHLVSKELAAPDPGGVPRRGAAVLLGRDVGVMVNEEDHLRLQGLASGLALEQVHEQVRRTDAELGQRLAFAFHPQFGYLTSCPTNVGTGLRASVLIHLPGLVLTKEIHRVLHGLAQVGLTYRGLYGEGSEVVGNFFQLSNQTTLGQSEGELLDHLGRIVGQVIGHEEKARQILLRDAPSILEDKVWRAFGLLRYARALGFEEAMNLLSGVRLGVGLGLVPDVAMYTVNRLLIETQSAHLLAMAGGAMDEAELPVRRARHVRMILEAEAGRRT
jgi:protein arginine kinase